MSNQSCAVQYGEIGMWSDVGFNICWTINSLNSTHIFPCGRLGDFGAAKTWKDKLQYLRRHHHLGLDILWQNGRLHHICGRSCHLKQDQNDRRINDTQAPFSPSFAMFCSAHFRIKRRDHFTFIAVLCYVSWNFGGRSLSLPSSELAYRLTNSLTSHEKPRKCQTFHWLTCNFYNSWHAFN